MNKFLWDLKAKLYRMLRCRFPVHFIIQQENRNLERLLQSIEIDGRRIVDLGTGTGNALYCFAQAAESFGVDLTLSMLLAAKQIHPGVSMIQADAVTLPLQNESADIVSAIGLSEYIKAIELLFIEVHRILKDRGYFLFTFSPYGIFTALRFLLGNRIYPRSMEQIEQIATKVGFQVVHTGHSFMQRQVLFHKIGN